MCSISRQKIKINELISYLIIFSQNKKPRKLIIPRFKNIFIKTFYTAKGDKYGARLQANTTSFHGSL